MTISSSLNAGVAGLASNASRLSTIADNIANSSTFGYKRVVTDFHSMVISSGDRSYTAGGVGVTTQRLIDERGPLIATCHGTGDKQCPVVGESYINFDPMPRRSSCKHV